MIEPPGSASTLIDLLGDVTELRITVDRAADAV
jgi:hypothetical protein